MTRTTPLSSVGLEAYLDSQRMNARHWAAFFLIALVLLADGMDVTIVSHIFPSLIDEWGVFVGGGIATLVSAGFIAMGLGALLAGRASDRWGRKPVLVATTLLFGAGTVLGATSGGFLAFSLWRLLACLGMGAAMATGNTLLADLMPPRRRSALIATAYAFVGLGTTVGATLAGTLIPATGWQGLLVVSGTIPVIVAIALGIIVPEAPTFLAARGDAAGAMRALNKIDPAAPAEDIDYTINRPQSETGSWKQLFSRRYAFTTVLLWCFGFFSLGTQLMVVQYLPTMLQLPNPGLDTVQSSTIIGLYGLTSTISVLLFGALLIRASRFIVIGSTLLASAIVVLLLALAPSPGYGALLVLLSITGFILPAACGPTRSVLAAAAYPTEIRGTGVGSTEFSGRIGSAAGGALGGVLIGAGLGLGGFFLAVLVPITVLLATLVGLGVGTHNTAADPKPTPTAMRS